MRIPALWLGSTAIFLALPAFSQTAETVDLDAILLESDTAEPAATEAITRDEIAFAGADSASTLFRDSTSVQTTGGIDTATKLFVNGLESTTASVTLDGAPVGAQSFHHTGPGGLNPRLFKQADVYAGITPADIGPFASAGALVFTTVDAADLLAPGATQGGSVSLSYGSNGDEWSYEVTSYGAVDRFDYVLSLGQADGGNYTDGKGDVVPYSATDLSSAMIKLGYDLGEGRRLGFSSTYYRDATLRNLRADLSLGSRSTGDPIPVGSEATTQTYTLELTDDLVEGALNPEARLTFSRQDLFNDRSNTGLSFGNLDTQQDTTTVRLQNRVALGMGELRFGLDHLDVEATNHTAERGERLTNTGLFVQADAELTPKLSLSGGLRYDWTEFTGYDGSGFSAKDDGYSANIYAEYAATDWLVLDAGASHVFGGYDLSETALLGRADGYTTGPAETAHNYRFGFTAELPSGVFGGLHAFRTALKDVGDGGEYELASYDLESKGWEAELGYRSARGQVSLRYRDADVKRDGEALTGYSDYAGAPLGPLFVLAGDYAFENGLKIGGTVRVAPSYELADETLPAYQLVDFAATYTPPSRQNLELRLGIDNLFDEAYASRGARNVDEDWLNFEPGRSINLQATMRF